MKKKREGGAKNWMISKTGRFYRTLKKEFHCEIEKLENPEKSYMSL